MNDLSKKNNANTDFEKRILSEVAKLQPYVKHRLYTAEINGIIPLNMFKSNEIIDDAILKLYGYINEEGDNGFNLKLKFFSFVNDRLDRLFKKEEFHKYTMSTSQILKKELELFEENFESDLDEDLLMSDELDDISYRQDDFKKPSFLYDDAEKNIINTLEVHDPRKDLSEEKRNTLNKIYNWLPFETSNILDLFVFGKLTYEEISEVKKVSTSEVKETIRAVSKNLRKNLN